MESIAWFRELLNRGIEIRWELEMTNRLARSFFQFIPKIATSGVDGDLVDRRLLERFVHDRDEGAFAALVERHGRMVLGVCRRVLGDEHDAEDAFQATFLVLVRKAASLGKQGLLSNWLYGVAYRTALKARANAAKRQAREQTMTELPAADQTDEVVWRDLRPILDEELSRLPQRYRAAVVLCYLEGKSTEEAAETLGCPKGTILSRLSRARERLRGRFTRRGVVVTSISLAGVLTHRAAEAAVPASLSRATIEFAIRSLSAPVAATGQAVPIAALANAVVRALFVHRLKTLTLICGLILLLSLGGIATVHLFMGGNFGGLLQNPFNKAPVPIPDEVKIQGTWRVVDMEPPVDANMADAMRRFSWTIGPERILVKAPGAADVESNYSLKSAQKPKILDMLFPNARNPAQAALWRMSYALNDDELRIHFAPPGVEVPEEPRIEPGKGGFVMIFHREVAP